VEEKILYIADKLLSLTPMIRKKIGRPIQEDPPIINHTHYMILLNLKNEGRLSVSDIGRRLVISKPNMTPLIDKLIKVGFTKRIPDENDRRIVNIELTDEGMKYLNERRAKNLEHLKQKLVGLPAEKLDSLVNALDTLYSSLSMIE
jgi:DNA-binding MarR family transcriptional regulator